MSLYLFSKLQQAEVCARSSSLGEHRDLTSTVCAFSPPLNLFGGAGDSALVQNRHATEQARRRCVPRDLCVFTGHALCRGGSREIVERTDGDPLVVANGCATLIESPWADAC